MRAVIQRVRETTLKVEGELIAKIPSGWAVYLGVAPLDTETDAATMAKKIAALRIFEDAQGKMNLSTGVGRRVEDVLSAFRDAGGEVLLISQFTLYGDCTHGNRPSFIGAARPEYAKPLYEKVAELLRRAEGLAVQTGIFGADMKIEQYNDGPVTILYEC